MSFDPCTAIFRRLDRYLDRSLSGPEQAEVEAHLEACASCAREFRFEAGLEERLRAKLGRISAPPELFARVFAELKS